MRKFTKVLSVTLIIALLFTLGGCGSLTKKITDEAKAKISEQLETDKDDEDTEDTEEAEDTQDAEDTKAPDDNEDDDSTAITTSDGKSMDWPTDNMGDIAPVSCKITAVFTDGSSGSVTFEGMERKEADKYLADFESMGYKDGVITEDESGVLFMKANDAGDSIWFSYAPDGTGLITFTAADES